MRKLLYSISLCLLLLLFSGCAGNRLPDPNSPDLTGMYLPLHDDMYIWGHTKAEEQNGGPLFHCDIPEGQLYDSDGKKLTREDLNPGDIIGIYGEMECLESYPPFYLEPQQMLRLSIGKEEDTAVFDEELGEFYIPPDPAEPPTLQVQAADGRSSWAAMINRGGYEWNYPNEDGTMQSVVADSKHILEWTEPDLAMLSDTTELKLLFSEVPEEVEVTCWPASAQGKTDTPGTLIEAVKEDGVFVIKELPSGSVYRILGTWTQGTAEYGFFLE